MRSTTVGLALIVVIATGCASGSAQRTPSQAGATSDPARAAASSDPKARETRARELLVLGRTAMASGDLVAATRSFREALRLQPNLVEARENLGLALYEMGDLDGTVEELRALLSRHPDAVRARLVLATALMAKQDWAAARPELEEVLRRQPDLVQALYSLGLVRYARGDLNGAIEAYRQVLARVPDHADARYNLALVLKLTHRDAEAAPEFLAAAGAGHPRAPFFARTGYPGGRGGEPETMRAILWGWRAGRPRDREAIPALAELRQTALGKRPRGPRPSG